MFIPTSKEELDMLGWKQLDIILVTGDTYVDSPFIGVSVIGKVLLDAGYRVGIIAQPDVISGRDICRLGEPRLFWGITSGCMDSMISNYTSLNKWRRQDDLTGGGLNNRRPDLAVIAYTNLVRRFFKKTRPIVIGGIEASLRRISHYHYATDSVRRSILFDAKADILVYGMGERTILELANRIRRNHTIKDVRGICYASPEKTEGYIELPTHADVAANPGLFISMFKTFYQNNDWITAKGMCQKQDSRYLIHNPPQAPLSTSELDHVHELDYMRDVHSYYASWGLVRALETIRFSLITHRGCYGECHFCSISVHEGRTVTSRSEVSIIKEASVLTHHPGFKGTIYYAGGPTANMFGIECDRKKKRGACRNKHCLTPVVCEKLEVNHGPQIALLKRLRVLPKVKKVSIGSGIRHDLVLADQTYGIKYLEQIIKYHVSGQLKLAPEHSEDHVLDLMGKPRIGGFIEFKRLFEKINLRLKKKQFLTCYFIAAYPGCTLKDMERLRLFSRNYLKFRPRQVQIFTPSPSTTATMMYLTERSYDNSKPLFVEKNNREKKKQKDLILK
jgi:uncharacterized radical SAM protein YgiQ